MVLRHQTTERFSSPALAIHTFDCRHDNRDFGPEELATADQIVFVRGGAWELRADGENHLLDSQSVVLFRRGETYRVRHPVRGGDRCTVLTLRAGGFRRLLGGHGPGACSGPEATSHRRVLRAESRVFLFHHLLLAHLRSATDPCTVEESSLALAAAVFRRSSGPTRAHREPVRARTTRLHAEIADHVRRVMGARFRERLLLSDLADDVLWSPYHLARIFRRVTGVPVHRYLTRLRLRFAVERMLEGARPLADVASEAGFSSQGHFTTAFRSEFGRSPARLRRGVDASALRETSKILEDQEPAARDTRPHG